MKPIPGERDRTEYFRAGVGAMLIDASGNILVLKRADVTTDAWQMPQGGIRRGEDLQEALRACTRLSKRLSSFEVRQGKTS